jgi:hypothetical protein
MTCKITALSMGLLAGGMFLLSSGARAADPKSSGHEHKAHFDACAKACADCMRECESCARHCAEQLAAGNKEHGRTLGACADCADVCASAAKIVARQGPLSAAICESCAKVCDECGAACEKFSDDAHMKRCAKECRDCAKACREMLKHAASGVQR